MSKLTNKKFRKNINKSTCPNYYLVIFIIMILLNFMIVLKNYWTGFLLTFLFVFLIVKKINKYQIIFGFICILWYLLLSIFVSPKIDLFYIVNWINTKTNFFYLRNKLIKYLEKVYNNEIALSVIKLFIFNIKSSNVNEIILSAKWLDILFLFTVSGMHINLLLWLIRKIFHKNQIICEVIEWILIISIGYFLNFSIPSLRILFTKIFKYKFKTKDAISLSGILNSLLFINITHNFGFILSYGCTFCIDSVLKLKTRKYLQAILMNLICSLFSSFILLTMNNKINVMSVIYNFCLSPLIMLWYLWIQLTFLIHYLQNLQAYIYQGYYWIIKTFCSVNFNIYLTSNIKQIFILFYSPFIWLWIKN